jgi:hypothetical protein
MAWHSLRITDVLANSRPVELWSVLLASHPVDLQGMQVTVVA